MMVKKLIMHQDAVYEPTAVYSFEWIEDPLVKSEISIKGLMKKVKMTLHSTI